MNDPLHPHHFAHQPLDTTTHLFPTSTAPPTLVSQHDLGPLDFSPFDETLDGQTDLTNPFDTSPPPFDPRNPPRFHEIRSTGPLDAFPSQQHGPNHFDVAPRVATRRQNEQTKNQGQFGVLTPHPQLVAQPHSHAEALGQLQNEIDLRSKSEPKGGTTDGHFSNLKMIPDPPDLEQWRQKLFNVNETITMNEDQ